MDGGWLTQSARARLIVFIERSRFFCTSKKEGKRDSTDADQSELHCHPDQQN